MNAFPPLAPGFFSEKKWEFLAVDIDDNFFGPNRLFRLLESFFSAIIIAEKTLRQPIFHTIHSFTHSLTFSLNKESIKKLAKNFSICQAKKQPHRHCAGIAFWNYK